MYITTTTTVLQPLGYIGQSALASSPS